MTNEKVINQIHRRRAYRQKRHAKRVRFFMSIIILLLSINFLWMFTSYIEILIHNGDALSGTPYEYPESNFFVFLDNLGK